MTTERVQYRPKRHIRHEIYSLIAVLCAPFIIAIVFPYGAIGFRAADEKPAAPSLCAFVTLSEEETDAAIAAARSAIKTSSGSLARLRADLSLSSIPEESSLDVADISQRTSFPKPGIVTFDDPLLPATCAAPPPATIAPSGDKPAKSLPFPRLELLQL